MRAKGRDRWEIFEIVAKGLGVLLVPIVIAIIGNEINQQQKTTEQISRFANQVASEKPRERLVAVIMLGHYAKAGNLDPTLQFALLKIATGDPDPEVRKTAIALLPEQDKNKMSESLPRVYIHIQADRQNSSAQSLRDKLATDGKYIMGPIQLVKEGPMKTQVRYFSTNDIEKAKKLSEAIGSEAKIIDLSKQYGEGEIPKGLLEVWYGKSSP